MACTSVQLSRSIDDVLDYSGDSEITGKNVGDDLAEGKPTLPLLFAMKHGTPEESGIIRAAILEGDASHFQQILHRAANRRIGPCPPPGPGRSRSGSFISRCPAG
jgi:hypothetical protein